MAKIELYTFSEVVKALEIDSNELNELILAEKIRPVRHQGRLKFKKVDVDNLKKTLPKREPKPAKPVTAPIPTPVVEQPPSAPSTPGFFASLGLFNHEKEFYSWDEAQLEMQLSKQQLEKVVSEQAIPVYEGADGFKFKISDVKEWKRREADRFVTGDNAALSVPSNLLAADDAHATLDVSLPTFGDPAPAASQPEEQEELYNFDQVLSILQMEMAALQRLIDDGELVALPRDGKMKFRKSEIEILRHERMLNATLMIEPGKIKVDEEEDIQPIVISAASELALPAMELPEELCSFDEATYLLQIDAAELKRMVAHQKISPLRGEDGQLKFRKEDIKRCSREIESTLILPDEPDSKEKTGFLPDNAQASTVNASGEKSFFTFVEAAKILKVSEQQITAWVNDGTLRTYRNEGQRSIKKADLQKMAEKLPPSPAVSQETSGKENRESQQYLTLEETKRLLNKEEKEIKIMVARGQLQVSRSAQGYLFAKSSIDVLLGKTNTVRDAQKEAPKATARPDIDGEESYTPLPEDEPETCSVQEAAKLLNIGKADIQRLVKEQKLRPLTDGKFVRKELEKLKQNKIVEVTMVLPLMQENIQEENEKVAFVASPQIGKTKNEERPPALAESKLLPATKPSAKAEESKTAEMSEADLKKFYYSWREVLTALQMEEHELEKLVQHKVLDCRNYNGKKWLKKTNVDQLKNGKMIEPTLIVGDDGPNILDDEEDDMFLQ